jgi:outer membrane biosynthesis protein TonB
MAMLANWMLYCAAVGVLLSGGALALERGLRSLGRPTRWVWAGAMALTLAVPAAARFVPAPPAAPAAVDAAPAGTRMRAPAAPLEAKTAARWAAPLALDLGGWDPALRVAWGASSAAVLLGLAAMAAVLARRRRGWSAAEVDGVPVLVSPDVGPAVVGLFRSRIVLPAWALAADEEARRLVLEHEREHVRAGDPRLLAAAIVCAALTPWNPAAWWQLRRLRLAIEVDCDARVLRRRADVRAYGSVLLEVGRRAVRSRLAAAAFAEPVSSLERRIRIMTAPRVRRPLLRAAAFGALAAALVAAACEAPQPTQPPTAGPSFAKSPLTPQTAVAHYFPEVATKGTGRYDFLEFVVTAEGEVVHHAWVRGALAPGVWSPGSDPHVRAGMTPQFRGKVANYRLVRFQPGEVGPTATEVAWTVLRPTPGSSAAAAGDDPQSRAVRDAVRRHYPPVMRDAGVTARVSLSFVVGADGRARNVEVVDDGVDPAFAQAARAVVADLTFPAGKPGEETVMVLDFALERTPAPGTMPRGTVSGRTENDGFKMVATMAQPQSTGMADQGQLQAAMDRFYTPAMRIAGVSGTIEIRYTVGADGRARDVVVNSGTPALVPVGRAIVESLTFAGPVTRETSLVLNFDPYLTPTRSR